ncbi:MAG: glycosyltransferase family protein [Rhodospirillales bacterium]
MRRKSRRILIYSHDSFGLGHHRRCRTVAHALVEADEDLSVLILSGSPIIGSFDFKSRVDFVRVPGVIKLRNGDYTSLKLPIAVEEMLALRASIVEHTAQTFDPDLFLVDKEPLGLRGEAEPTLALMRQRGVPCVLGLRDVMDDPELLETEWARKNSVQALTKYYDEIWVYGLPQICEPLAGIDLPASLKKAMVYTGYLRRSAGKSASRPALEKISSPYILVTVGGGGDGEEIIDWVLSAYETQSNLPYPALMVLGPFMASERQSEFLHRAAKLDMVEALTFDAHIETLLERAIGVVCMGGYNTFCEILSFDKRAIVVPRTQPRKEQFLRASKAQELGLVHMLTDDGERRAIDMATALRHLPQQPLPSQVVVPGLLDGVENVVRLASRWQGKGRHAGEAPQALRAGI